MKTKSLLKQAKCQMQLVCNKEWEQLSPTDESGIKFCGDCKKLVFYTQTAAELNLAAKRGLCVYIVPRSLASTKGISMQYDFPGITRERIIKIEERSLKRLKGPTLGMPIIR